MSITWTKDKPTESGWYWVRRRGGVDRILEVLSTPDGPVVWDELAKDRMVPAQKFQRFAGPIPHPGKEVTR